ncbi:tRNA (guanine(37)-N1)-methyltransferase [Babesia divergens]|uniref:tRNA (guanine(37)-N1)-methyltransferase n=1 Tax=Babesia divergens TaxID=32595 RepID=A0AAD9G6J4_BABDI|nr:tRNA (guanine(37)-N1)-methyltransferase [Babesia divergens]
MPESRLKRPRVVSCGSQPTTCASRKVTSIEELENYVIEEKCLFVAIRMGDQSLFAEKGFFRSLAKNYRKLLITSCSSHVAMHDDAKCFVLRAFETLAPDLQELIKNKSADFHPFTNIRRYEDFSLDECLRLLGDENGVMVSFETVGHIAHLNLPTERLWAKDIIAKILLDKHKHIRTVVNKVKEVDNKFRTMELELLGGEDNLVTTQLENRYTFKIDFRNVYWNSRLIQERERISDTFHMGDVVVDMFAGVGPFAIYAAARGCLVFANDLNPVGAQYIDINASLNKCSHLISSYNMDAREFARTISQLSFMDKGVMKYKDYELKPESKVHFVMNLPKDAIEFLDVFNGLLHAMAPESQRTCMVHCYCFSAANDVEADIDERIERTLQRRIDSRNITKVRDVSPKKHMYCIEFNMPPEVLSSK